MFNDEPDHDFDTYWDDEGSVVMIDHTGTHELYPTNGRWYKGRKVSMVVKKNKAKRAKGRADAIAARKTHYVGSKDIAASASKGTAHNEWPLKTEADAIAQAKELCANSGRPQIVVRIVALIEPSSRPVSVKKV